MVSFYLNVIPTEKVIRYHPVYGVTNTILNTKHAIVTLGCKESQEDDKNWWK